MRLTKKCKKLVAVGLTISVGLSSPLKGISAMAEENEQFVTDSTLKTNYIAVTESDTDYNCLEKTAEEKEILAEEQPAMLQDSNMLLLELSESEAQQVEQLNGVVSIEEDSVISANEEVPIDENETEALSEQSAEITFNQWNMEAVDLPQNLPYTGTGIKVAVMDSGISFAEDINVKERIDLVNTTPDEDFNPLFDDATGHGTSIAGIVAAGKSSGDIYGIAEDVELYSVKVLDICNEAPVSRIIDGIYWCINHDMDVINMSFGMTGYSAALEKAVSDAADAGIIMVAAAGNHGDRVGGIDYPAAYEDVIAVGASTGENRMADFTSVGEGIDVLAPGEKVWSYSMLQGLMAINGTSIATAHVTGAVALLLENNPNAEGEFVRQLLKASSVLAEGETEVGVLKIGEALAMQGTFQMQERVAPQEGVPQECYDTEGIVTGCWGNTPHQNSVTAASSAVGVTIMSQMAAKVDGMYSTTAGYGPLHGQHNYVANLHYLYKAARNADGTKYDLTDASDVIEFTNGISVKHTADKIRGMLDLDLLGAAIVDALTTEHTIDGKKRTLAARLGATTKKQRSYLIMGMAAHLLGDIFAHRTMVPKMEKENVSQKFNKSDFVTGDWEGFKDRVADFVIEFRDIKTYGADTSTYEDNTSFYPNRYTATKETVKQLINYYIDDMAFDSKGIIVTNTFKLKLNNFQAYAISAGYADDVSGMSTSDFRVDLEKPKKNEADYEDYLPNVHQYK